MVSTGLLQQGSNTKPESATEGKANPIIQKINVETDDQGSNSAQIVTTDEEVAAFQIVKGILERAGKDVRDLNYRDTVNYFSINNQTSSKWLMRFVLHSDKKNYCLPVQPRFCENITQRI